MRLKDPDYLAEKYNRRRRLSLEELSISIIKASKKKVSLTLKVSLTKKIICD